MADRDRRVEAQRLPGERQAAQPSTSNAATTAPAPAAPTEPTQPSQPPPGYIVKRIIINSAFYLTWVPYIILLANQDLPGTFRDAIILGESLLRMLAQAQCPHLHFGGWHEFRIGGNQ